ncbi:hypothetical protein AHF37_11164 [Paragonimus kellicotti]|nr:hypothetical protein AHF37_11164 [Paragonimus kellicotti]
MGLLVHAEAVHFTASVCPACSVPLLTPGRSVPHCPAGHLYHRLAELRLQLEEAATTENGLSHKMDDLEDHDVVGGTGPPSGGRIRLTRLDDWLVEVDKFWSDASNEDNQARTEFTLAFASRLIKSKDSDPASLVQLFDAVQTRIDLICSRAERLISDASPSADALEAKDEHIDDPCSWRKATLGWRATANTRALFIAHWDPEELVRHSGTIAWLPVHHTFDNSIETTGKKTETSSHIDVLKDKGDVKSNVQLKIRGVTAGCLHAARRLRARLASLVKVHRPQSQASFLPLCVDDSPDNCVQTDGDVANARTDPMEPSTNASIFRIGTD